ncbi:sugar ABC transporter permease [Polymorphospora sp. NPDC050346]|uniref:carbohydrate ABC transporter permease n=1 Tax=Polymorphospora sp. NPDC050346 TaxID=3155780 RepID=UPI003408432A
MPGGVTGDPGGAAGGAAPATVPRPPDREPAGPDRPARAARRRPRLPVPVLLIAPSVVFLAALFLWPVVVGVSQAFTGTDGATLAHLRRMVDDPYFWPAVRNTALLIVVLIPLQFAFALAMALLLRSRPRLSSFYFYVWCVPLAVSDLAAGLIWLSILTDRGYLNSVLAHLGLGDGFAWLSYQNPTTMFIAVLLAELWRATSLVLVIVVAGLQNIPRDYDEAAAVFGAGYWQRLWHVILPQLRPSLQVALILRTILGLQTFAVAQALTGRNFPLLVGETYQWYVVLQNERVAAAIALVILAVSIGTAMVYLRVLRDPSIQGRR